MACRPAIAVATCTPFFSFLNLFIYLSEKEEITYL
jgi:hypothetical protein